MDADTRFGGLDDMATQLYFEPLPQLAELIADEGNERTFYVNGFECRAIRLNHPWAGYINGYIKVPSTHPWWGKDIDQLYDISVHGGVTYSESGLHTSKGDEQGWWVGFDTAHWQDLNPCKLPDGIEIGDPTEFQTYRTMEYVIEQLKSLARQATTAA
jgi:hypothetical protein